MGIPVLCKLAQSRVLANPTDIRLERFDQSPESLIALTRIVEKYSV